MKDKRNAAIAAAFPEVGAGGFTRVDGSLEFYSRVQSLLRADMRVLDFGAGRAQWFEDDACEYRRAVRQIKGKVREVVACDVDPAVLQNRAADVAIHVPWGESLPFSDASFQLVVADYVFEHLDKPETTTRELDRVLAPGGWICARTPNAFGYVALVSRLIGNKAHVSVLKHAQPERKSVDVFPTLYRLNTLRSIDKYFSKSRYENYSYRYDAEPAYFFGNRLALDSLRLFQWLLPPQCSSQLFVFLRKRMTEAAEQDK